MYKIPYTYTNKSKIVFYLMISAYFILRLILMVQIKVYNLEGYEVFLLPTILYYLTIFIVLTAIFFGYKFFFTTYNEETITYHNILLKRAASIDKGACIFGYYVKDPRAYGVVEFDANGKAISLEEKPAEPKSNYAVPGLYFYDSTVTKKAASLKPSARGEYEITDLNRLYLNEGTLKVELFGRGFAWLDTGNCDSLLEASNFVATIQNRQGFRVSCIEEIAWRKGWIDVDQLYRLGEQLGKTEYGKYLMELAESKR